MQSRVSKMKILKDVKNQLLKRRELDIVVEADKNPSFEEATKTIVDSIKADPENLVVKEIKGKFGRKTFLIRALVYDTKEDKEKTEPKPKKKKGEGEAAGEAAPAPAAPAEEYAR